MKTYILIIGILYTGIASSQNVDLMLLGNIEKRVDYLKERLDLSDQESYRLTDILYKHATDKASIDVFASNPGEVYGKIIANRDEAIQSAIGDKKFKVFSLFEQIEKEDLLKEYAQLFRIGAKSDALNEKLIAYRLRYILPKLSQENRSFVRSISLERILELKRMQDLYYEYCNITDMDNRSFAEYLGPTKMKSLRNLINTYKKSSEASNSDLDRYRTKWSKDQDKIAYDHMATLNISEEQKAKLSKGQFTLKEDLFILHVLMIAPSDNEKYLKNLDVIMNQQKKFENLTN